jgi:hypothetical protein
MGAKMGRLAVVWLVGGLALAGCTEDTESSGGDSPDPAGPECADGVDNDDDGLIDGADPDCLGAMDDSESGGAVGRSDGGMDSGPAMDVDGATGDAAADGAAPVGCGEFASGETSTRTLFEAATVAHGEMCRSEEQTCTCADGEWVDCTGTFAAEACEVLCPEGATRMGGTDEAPLCECEPGMMLADDACVSRCPENAHYDVDADRCACDEDYFVVDGACVHAEDLCPENSHFAPGPDGAPGCACDEGFVTNVDRDACVPRGEECPEGLVPNFDRDACVPPGEECPEGRPRIVINGELILCCPADAVSVVLSGRMASCNCAEGERYNPAANTCD